MRILSEIIDDVTNGKMPSHEECYYALKVYRFLNNSNQRLVINEFGRSVDVFKNRQAQIALDAMNGALKSKPNEWLGE